MPDPTEAEINQALGWADGAEDEGAESAPSTPVPTGQPVPAATTDTPIPTVQAPPTPIGPAAPNFQQLYEQNQREALENAQTAQVKDGINVRAGQYMNQLIAGGTEEPAARESATQYANAAWHEHRATQAERKVESTSQTQLASNFSVQYGVPVQEIVHYPTPEAMEAAAQRIAAANTRLTTLETQVRAANLAPVQEVDSGQGGGAPNSDKQYILDYAMGKDVPPDIAKRLFG